MKLGKKSIITKDGRIKEFKSEKARDNYERVARATKHGFKPDKTKKKG